MFILAAAIKQFVVTFRANIHSYMKTIKVEIISIASKQHKQYQSRSDPCIPLLPNHRKTYLCSDPIETSRKGYTHLLSVGYAISSSFYLGHPHRK